MNLKTKKKKRQRKENNVKNIRKSWKNSKHTKKGIKRNIEEKDHKNSEYKTNFSWTIVDFRCWISLTKLLVSDWC